MGVMDRKEAWSSKNYWSFLMLPPVPGPGWSLQLFTPLKWVSEAFSDKAPAITSRLNGLKGSREGAREGLIGPKRCSEQRPGALSLSTITLAQTRAVPPIPPMHPPKEEQRPGAPKPWGNSARFTTNK